MRVKMRLLMLLVICMAVIRCASSTVPEKNYEYRYNVEVIYTRPANAEIWPGGNGYVQLIQALYDPAHPENFNLVGGGMFLTSLILIVGFSVFLFAASPLIRYFGILSILALVTGLAGDCNLLPVLVRMVDGQGPEGVRA